MSAFEQNYLKPRDIADRLGVPRTTVYELIRSGRLPHIRIGHTIRVPAAAFQAYLDRLEAPIKVQKVEPLEGSWLRLSFSDGVVKDIDVGGLLEAGGVFAPIRDGRDVFRQVRVNPQSQTVEWPGGVDLDAEVLYGRHEPASGMRIERRIVRRPAGEPS
jgi:excisionase family DNA binding protein